MQKSENFTKKENEKEKEGKNLFGKLNNMLKNKDEREVRSRLQKFISFMLTLAASYLAGGVELFFGTFPVALALICSTKAMLLPVISGLVLLFLTGRLPKEYIFVCIAIILVRILCVILPRVFFVSEESVELTEYVPLTPTVSQKRGAFKSSDSEMISDKPVRRGTEQSGEKKKERADLRQILDSLFCEDIHIKMLCGAAGGFLCGLLALIETGFSFYSFCATLFLTLSVPLIILALGGYFGEEKYKKEWYKLISLGAVFALCVLGAQGVSLLGMPVAPTLALLITLYICSDRGLPLGICAALLCGLAFDLVYLPMLLICAVLFCLVSAVKKNAGLPVVCAVIVIWCYYIGGESGLVGVLPPMLLAIPVYMLADKYREMMTSPYRQDSELAYGLYFAEAVTEKTKNQAVKERLNALSEAFSSMSETFYKLSDRFRRPDVLGIKKTVEENFERNCEGCRNREICWGADYANTLDVMKCVSAALHKKGSVSKDDLPEGFLSSCLHSDKTIEDVNRAISAATENIIKGDKFNLFSANYDDVTAILKDALDSDSDEYECDMGAGSKTYEYLCSLGVKVRGVVVYGKRGRYVVAKGVSSSEDMSAEKRAEICKRISEIVGSPLTEPIFEVGKDGSVMLMHTKPTVKAHCAHGSLPAQKEEESSDEKDELYVDPFAEEELCGDKTEAFITDSSYFYSLISDGMGSGGEAAFTSSVCGMFIEKMLSAGNRADITLRMLNNVIRSENLGCGSECSATVDLLELDLMSGRASFIKSGAAPTYIAREGTVYKISSRTMPVGIIKDADARITKFDTKEGDIIVMISDGCCPDSEDCPWLVEYLCGYMSKNKNTAEKDKAELCRQMKEELLSEAVKNFPEGKERDDISVSVTIIG